MTETHYMSQELLMTEAEAFALIGALAICAGILVLLRGKL